MARLSSDEAVRVQYEGQAAMNVLRCEGWEWYEERIRAKIRQLEIRALNRNTSEDERGDALSKREALLAMIAVPQAAADEYNQLLRRSTTHG